MAAKVVSLNKSRPAAATDLLDLADDVNRTIGTTQALFALAEHLCSESHGDPNCHGLLRVVAIHSEELGSIKDKLEAIRTSQS